LILCLCAMLDFVMSRDLDRHVTGWACQAPSHSHDLVAEAVSQLWRPLFHRSDSSSGPTDWIYTTRIALPLLGLMDITRPKENTVSRQWHFYTPSIRPNLFIDSIDKGDNPAPCRPNDHNSQGTPTSCAAAYRIELCLASCWPCDRLGLA